MLPRSWCVDYTQRSAWSLVAKYSEGMKEDAPLIFFLVGIKSRHCAIDEAAAAATATAAAAVAIVIALPFPVGVSHISTRSMRS